MWIPLEVLVSKLSKEEMYHYTYSYAMAASEAGSAVGGFSGWLPEIASRALLIPAITAYRATLAACLAMIFREDIREGE